MKRLILLSLFVSTSVFADQGLDMLPIADQSVLEESRGMGNLPSQENISKQAGVVSGNNMSNAIVSTGANYIAPGALSGSNGIIMLNMSSGNNNITNMSTSVNITSVR